MPLRSPKMKRRIFGFQRRVWWPKWTPASNSCFMLTTAISSLPSVRPDTGLSRLPAPSYGRPWARTGRFVPRPGGGNEPDSSRGPGQLALGLGEAGAQLEDGLGVDLADPRLGHT